MRRWLSLPLIVLGATALAGGVAHAGTPPAPIPAAAQGTAYQLVWSQGQPPSVTQSFGTVTALQLSASAAIAAAASGGRTACSLIIGAADKGFLGVTVDSSDVCTPDVYYINLTQDLFRGLPPSINLIGAGNKAEEASFADITTGGACARSTWAYYGEIATAYTCSSVNGCVSVGGYLGAPRYISC